MNHKSNIHSRTGAMLLLVAAAFALLLNPPALSAQEFLASQIIQANFTQLAVFSTNQSETPPCMLAYEQGNGAVQMFLINHSPSIPVSSTGFALTISGPGVTGLTSIVPFSIFTSSGSTPFYFAYNSATGVIYTNQVDPACKNSWTVSQTVVPAGLTHLMPFNFGGNPYLMAYNKAQAGVEFYQVGAGGVGLTALNSDSQGALAAGFTSVQPFTINNSPCFLAYDTTNGAVEFDQIVFVIGSGFQHNKTFISTWPAGITQVVTSPIDLQLLRYNAATGAVDFDSINSTGTQFVQGKSESWAPGVTLIAPFYFEESDDGSGSGIRIPGFVPYFAKQAGSVPAGEAQVWLF
ncbi:MAG TPA: hypothetical protein VI636_23070 [Candidatus Angelobacter sp.]